MLRPLTFSDIHVILHNVTLFVLVSVFLKFIAYLFLSRPFVPDSDWYISSDDKFEPPLQGMIWDDWNCLLISSLVIFKYLKLFLWLFTVQYELTLLYYFLQINITFVLLQS